MNQPGSSEQINQLLDMLETCGRAAATLSFTGGAPLLQYSDSETSPWRLAYLQQRHDMEESVKQSLHDFNREVRAIGGIPVKTIIGSQEAIVKVLGLNDINDETGEWTFVCKPMYGKAEFPTTYSSPTQLREDYIATLSPQ